MASHSASCVIFLGSGSGVGIGVSSGCTIYWLLFLSFNMQQYTVKAVKIIEIIGRTITRIRRV